MKKVVQIRKSLLSQAGVALVEMVLIASLVVAGGVTVLLTVIWPAYVKSSTEERLVAGFESTLAASRGVQRLSIEGNQLAEDLSILQGEAQAAIKQAEAVSGVPGQCAAVYFIKFDGTNWDLDRSVPFPRTFDSLGVDCSAPPPASLEVEVLHSNDPTQTGVQVRMVLYHPSAEARSFQRETTNIFSVGPTGP